MPRLYDRIWVNGVKSAGIWVNGVKSAQSPLPERSLLPINFPPTQEVFVIDNVADSFFSDARWDERGDMGHGFRPYRDFPCLAPAFPETWMEFKVPVTAQHLFPGAPSAVGVVFKFEDTWEHNLDILVARYPERFRQVQQAFQEHITLARLRFPHHSDEAVREQAWWYTYKDYLAMRIGYDDSPVFQDQQAQPEMVAATRLCALLNRKNVRWIVAAHIYMEHRKGDIYGPYATYFYPLNDQGEMLRGCTEAGLLSFSPTVIRDDKHGGHILATKIDDVPHMPEGMAPFALYPALLATTFLHIKSQVEIAQAVPNMKMERAFRKRYDRLPVRYKVLDIKPGKLTSSGGGRPNGQKVALHIVRGHFADYRHGNGLFGRHKKLIYFGPHIRGSLTEGVVDKDYTVDALQEV